jgi:hypothetical protein
MVVDHRSRMGPAKGLLPVALLSALVVVAVYEVRGRIARSGLELAVSAGDDAPPYATSDPPSERLVDSPRETCGELSRRTLSG